MARKKDNSVHFDRESRSFVNISPEIRSDLDKSFPEVDIEAELTKMKYWLLSDKGAKRKGEIIFITRWLSNAPVSMKQLPPKEHKETSIRPILNDYLKELWTGREFLLDLNKSAI